MGVKCGPSMQAWSAFYPFVGPQVHSPHFIPGPDQWLSDEYYLRMVELMILEDPQPKTAVLVEADVQRVGRR